MAVNYKVIDDNYVGASPLTQVDAAAKLPLGTICTGVDQSAAAYGQGEFRYVKFTGNCTAGDFMVIDNAGQKTVQASTTSAKGQIGIAMATHAAAATTADYGWCMIRGTHDGANVATGQTDGTALGVSSTAGRATATSAGNKIDAAFERVVTSASNVGTAEVNWPAWTGNG